MEKIAHFMYVPFTGLGLYNGHRGKRWLQNRIKIFKQFVIPSLHAQTNRDFIIWVSWRHEDRGDKQVKELERYILDRGFRTVFTYSGVCFWDDKYPDEVAKGRLINALHGSMGVLINAMDNADTVLMTIQPSDDCYYKEAVAEAQTFFEENPDYGAFGYKKGFVADYTKLKIAEWNPKTTPPFYTIKFKRDVFIDPFKHFAYTGGYKSHEYVKDFIKSQYSDFRGFLVGTHGENISTIFAHPFTGAPYGFAVLHSFGLGYTKPLKISLSIRKILMRKLPYGWQRKLRYWFGERLYSKFYNWIRA